MLFESLSEFDKDVKKLLKKYRSLISDFEDVKVILRVKPDSQNPFSFRIDNLGINTCIINVKKIASDSFKGRGVNSGLRLICAYFPGDKKIIFIELYHKNDKTSEDRQRILDNFK